MTHDMTQLLAPGHSGGKGGFTGKFMVMLNRKTRGDNNSLPCKFCELRFKFCKELEEHMIKKHKGERVTPAASVARLSSLCQCYNSTRVDSTGAMSLCARTVARRSRPMTA